MRSNTSTATDDHRTGLGPGLRRENEHTWLQLRSGIDKVMNRDAKVGIDMKTYVTLYSCVHNFCTSQKGINNQANMSANHAQRGAHLLGEDLYNNLKDYLADHLNDVRELAPTDKDDELLQYYIKQWENFTTAAGFVNHLFKYLNRHWVKREIDEGKKNVYDIYTLHLVQWRDVMFTNTQESVMAAVLRMVERQRNGDSIEHSQIKSVVNSFVSLGIDESEHNKGTLDVYKAFFEKPFLDETKAYYDRESRQFLEDNSVVEYMKKAEIRLQEEKDRIPLYLLAEIHLPLTKTCNTALIANHAELLRNEFKNLLENDRLEDLGRMYKLLERIPEGLNPLRKEFELHVQAAGESAVRRVKSSGGDSLEPKSYVDALLAIHTHYQDLVSRAFNGESEFVRSLDSACRQFVNHNVVCDYATSKSPELLAKYTDNLLRKSSQNSEEDDLETSLSQIMTIFKYIDDKDVFQKFYSRMLAKRLVFTTSASDDAETNMISKLKEACGFEYTNKLQRMFQDMQISKDLNSSFKDYQSTVALDSNDKVVDATYQILGTGFWPLNPPNTPFTPPQEIIKTYQRFQHFYTSKHNGRKLTWLWQFCKGEMRANYTKNAGNKIPYTLQVSTFQMAILLLFNDAKDDIVSYDDMVAATALSKETLDPSIAVCVKARVLIPEPDNAKPESGTSYRLNRQFKSKKPKVNLNINIKSEAKQEVEDTHKNIEEDRKLVIQSAIVRIMKSRKKLNSQLLVAETTDQIKARFIPTVADIKKCMDMLIEKEYLERVDGTQDIGYLA